MSVAFSPPLDFSTPALVVSGEWNLSPRPVKNIIGVKERYQKLFQPFLTSSRIKAPADVRQLYRVDLDGDGKDEVVAVLRNFSNQKNAEGSAKAPRYSAVAVRRIVKDRVDTLSVDVEIESAESSASEHTIPFIVDLNNDGTMEIVIYGRYLQGVYTAVYTLEGNRFRRVLSCSCGG